jgi:hypothetical protein
MSSRAAVAVALAALLGHAGPGLAQSSSPGTSTERAAKADQGGNIIIRFEGGDVNRDLAVALDTLEDLHLVPKESYSVGKAGPWKAIVAKTGLPKAYPDEMKKLLRRLNPKQKDWKKLGAPSVVFVKSDALAKVPVRRHFSSDDPRAQQRRESISKNWKDTVTDERGETRVDLDGFELTVPVKSTATGQKAVALLRGYAKGNAYARYRPNAEFTVGPYYARLVPRDYWQDPAHQKPDSNDQASMCGLVGPITLPACATTRCTAADCPDVMLVDSAVYPHFDVKDAIASGSELRTGVEVGDGSIQRSDRDVENAQHGTYMLGIIAAAEGNNRGLIGVHPGALLTTYDWDRYRNDASDFVRRMYDREDTEGSRLPVYVFATSWNVAYPTNAPPPDVDPSAVITDTDNESLRTQHAVARLIMGDPNTPGGSPALWVVAAGQWPKVTSQQLRLGKNIIPSRFTLGPMNLGDLPNVIVVTACEKCEPEDVVLEEKVNYSDAKYRGVHVVAPGRDVISTAPIVNDGAAEQPRVESRYASGNGTSPATAITAGVVSAMTSCYPSAFRKPWQAKERLQATSKPVFGGPGQNRFWAGIVDAEMALRDPSVTHLLKKATGEWRAVELLNWCVGALELLPEQTGRARALGTVSTKSLLRLKHGDAGSKPWVAYTRAPREGDFRRGDIVVHGPSSVKDVPSGALMKVREIRASGDGPAAVEEVVALADVLDLLPAPDAPKDVGPCN